MKLARKALFPATILFPIALLTLNAHAQTIRLGGAGVNYVERSERYVEGIERKVVEVSFRLSELGLEKEAGYQKLSLPGISSTSDLGDPMLPFQAVTVESTDVQVEANLGAEVALKVGKLLPAQEEPCRCPELDKRAKVFRDNLANFAAPAGHYRIDSLGDFRGTPMNRVVMLPHRYDAKNGMLYLYPNASYKISYKPSLAKRDTGSYDYLVIAKRDTLAALEPWIAHKRSRQNLRFNVVAFEDMNAANAASMKEWIHAEYKRAQFRYSLIVGGENQIPQMRVETTTDRNTPSDLPYYTMGGASDVVPEVHGGRIVADDSATVSRVLAKWMAYELDDSAGAGWSRAMGIASNEGANPSDAEYVTAIQDRFKADLGTESVYFYQDNADSNPNAFNAALNTGAWWVTYLGHGSGTDWPSFGSSYAVPHIAQIRNASAVKPVWIDVACLNGILHPSNAGAHLMGDADPDGAPIGTSAYFGGTVLVSWHPPAIFSRGVAFHVASTQNAILGDALQAGQKYLTENHSGLNDIASNQRWYHLQGDPSMRLRVK